MSTKSQNVKEYFMGSMSGRIAAGALAFTTAFLPMTGKLGNTFDGSANAQDVKPVKHHREMTAYEKGAAAQDYSISNNGIGVFVNFAAVPEIAPERLTKAIEANFAKKGIPINLQTNISRGDLTTVTFFLKGTPFSGPSGDGYLLGELPAGFDRIVKGYWQEQPDNAHSTGELHSAIR